MTSEGPRHASPDAAEPPAEFGGPPTAPWPGPHPDSTEPTYATQQPTGSVRASASVPVPPPPALPPQAYGQPSTAPPQGYGPPPPPQPYVPQPAVAPFVPAQGGPQGTPGEGAQGRVSGTVHMPDAAILPAHQLPALPVPVPRVYGRPAAPAHPHTQGHSQGPTAPPHGAPPPQGAPPPLTPPMHPAAPPHLSARPLGAPPPISAPPPPPGAVPPLGPPPPPAVARATVGVPVPSAPPAAPGSQPMGAQRTGAQQMGAPVMGAPVIGGQGQPAPPAPRGVRPTDEPPGGQALVKRWEADDYAASPSESSGSHTGLLIAVGVVVLLAVVGLTAFMWPRGSAGPEFAVNSCVKQSGNSAVAADCGATGAFMIVSKVDRPEQCTDRDHPYVELGSGRNRILCLSPAAGGGTAPTGGAPSNSPDPATT